MDFPKSVPGVGLVGGQFVDENQATGQVGSLIPAKWGNDVTTELLGVIEEAGLVPDEEDPQQLRAAVRAIVDKVAPVATKAEAETNDEATANNVKRMTPLRVLQAIKARLINATETVVGMLRVGTQEEVDSGALTAVAVTPATLKKHSSLGVNQVWSDFSSSRAVGTIYTNTTGRPIQVLIAAYSDGNTRIDAQIGSLPSFGNQSYTAPGVDVASLSFPVPPGGTYRLIAVTGTVIWLEMRAP